MPKTLVEFSEEELKVAVAYYVACMYGDTTKDEVEFTVTPGSERPEYQEPGVRAKVTFTLKQNRSDK